MRCPVCGGLYIYHDENTIFTCANHHSWHWGDTGLTVRMPPEAKIITLTVVRERPTPCPECIESWGQEPSAWGDSMLELDAYDEHMREHTKIDPDQGRWEGEGGR